MFWHWANDLRVNYFNRSSPIVGSELVTISVTSKSSTHPAGAAEQPAPVLRRQPTRLRLGDAEQPAVDGGVS
jgi:hypothetical protein